MQQMTFKDILVNSSVDTNDEIRISKQTHKILELLQICDQSNTAMGQIALQYNARIYEIRRYLEPHNKTIKLVVKGPDGINWYGIRPIREDHHN